MIKNKILGFSLAEMIVAISILSALISILLPALQSVQPSQNKVLMRKGYHVVEQAINSLINDDILYPTSDGFAITDGSKKLCENFVDALNWAEQGSVCGSYGSAEWIGTSPDGIDWYFYSASSAFVKADTTYSSIVVFDVNGRSNAPNCTYSTASSAYPSDYKKCTSKDKPDTFVVGIRWDGKLHMGGDATNTDSYATEILSSVTNNLND